jgi:hypothetical protein
MFEGFVESSCRPLELVAAQGVGEGSSVAVKPCGGYPSASSSQAGRLTDTPLDKSVSRLV